MRGLMATCVAIGLAGCGTTYELPKVNDEASTMAAAMFTQARATPPGATVTPEAAAARFRRVVARVKPAAVAFCRSEAGDRPAKVCDLPVVIDPSVGEANAYQTRDRQGAPFIGITVPMLLQVGNDDELAFMIAHEFGHHIADHIEKGERQALAGALILGALTATSQAYANQANPGRYTGADQADLQRSIGLGAAVGQRAYSQTYELESDVIAAHIARMSGYDAVNGARFFARPAGARTQAGTLSFWGTHPPNSQRLATVIAATRAADAGQGLNRAE